MKKIYLASPYGFTSAGISFMKNMLVPLLEKYFIVLNPWNSDCEKFIPKIAKKISEKEVESLKKLNRIIATENIRMIDKADYLIAVLDGTDVDSGVAAEIGYAYAKNKKIVGYRSDFRLTGDNIALDVNLQVEYFITNSGGKITRDTKELENYLKNIR